MRYDLSSQYAGNTNLPRSTSVAIPPLYFYMTADNLNASLSMDKNSTDLPIFDSNHISYAKSLQMYIAGRRTLVHFYLGDWLATLTPEMLNQLHELAELALLNGNGQCDAYLQVKDLCEKAFISENCPTLLPKTATEIANAIGHLQTLISLVVISKAGYIKLTKPLALSSDVKRKFVVTKAGRKMGIRLSTNRA